jgi:hypothetical protein
MNNISSSKDSPNVLWTTPIVLLDNDYCLLDTDPRTVETVSRAKEYIDEDDRSSEISEDS